MRLPAKTDSKQGICKYGSECTKIHTLPPNQHLVKVSDDTLTNPWVTPITTRSMEYYASTLPAMDSKSEELIAVNENGERIDSYFPMPPKDAWDSYNRRAKQHKLCNRYHLGGECGDLSCEFDHSYLDPSMVRVMGYILRQASCPRGPRCRSIKCYTGHHCQKDGCRGGKGCKFGRRGHTVDLHIAEWIAPIDSEEDGRLSPASLDTTDSASIAEEMSAFDMSRVSITSQLFY